MRILLHMCCGPCSVAVIEWLLERGHEVTGFFFNPNIHPLMEYMRRREAAEQVAAHYTIPLVFGDALPREEQCWSGCHQAGCRTGKDGADTNFAGLPPAVDPVLWMRMIHGCEHERCLVCWSSRLEKTAWYASHNGFDAITSSLLYSRYQNHALIKKLAETFAAQYAIMAVYADFREFWQYGIDRSKELGLYRQPYCGCVLSEYERYAKKLKKVLGS